MIQQYITIIETLFNRYKEKPTWKTLQSMFRYVLYLGIEIGKEQMRQNIEMMKEDEYVKRELNTKHSSHKTPEALMMLLELYANKSLIFDDNKIARKKAESLRAYSKYNQLEIKFRQEGRTIRLVR